MKNLLSFLSKKSEPAAPEVSVSPVVEAAAPIPQDAPGTAGEIKLYNVPDKQAAMVMAIVAEHTGLPLNQLRFRSIRLIEQK